MKNLAKYAAGFGLVLSLVMMGAAPSWSKAHDQGQSNTPGADVGMTTVESAQGLGDARGGGTGPTGTPGNSEDAGK